MERPKNTNGSTVNNQASIGYAPWCACWPHRTAARGAPRLEPDRKGRALVSEGLSQTVDSRPKIGVLQHGALALVGHWRSRRRVLVAVAICSARDRTARR